VRTLKSKVGELNERLGMLMETIQAKDEVIIKLSACEGSVSSPTLGPSSPLAIPASKDQLELDRLKVRADCGLAFWIDIANTLQTQLVPSLVPYPLTPRGLVVTGWSSKGRAGEEGQNFMLKSQACSGTALSTSNTLAIAVITWDTFSSSCPWHRKS
jgi:hypothetical protein